MAYDKIPTPDDLRKLLRYDPETGRMYWMPRPKEWFEPQGAAAAWNTRWAGREAFTAVNGNGYRHGAVLGKPLSAQRVAWAIVTGTWPTGQIDHINGNPTDNRFSNLRDVSQSLNSKNRRIVAPPRSGVVGVYTQPRAKKWVAMIGSEGRLIYLGQFATKDAAMAARRAAEIEHNFGPNHGLG